MQGGQGVVGRLGDGRVVRGAEDAHELADGGLHQFLGRHFSFSDQKAPQARKTWAKACRDARSGKPMYSGMTSDGAHFCL